MITPQLPAFLYSELRDGGVPVSARRENVLQRRMKAWIRMIAICLGVCLAFGDAAAKNQNSRRCGSIKSLFVSGQFHKYSVPYEQPQPNELVYALDVDSNGTQDELRAICGNGTDATCDLTLTLNKGRSFDFSLPASIRVMRINKSTYIATGVTLHRGGKIEVHNYAVHQLRGDRVDLICDTF